MLQRLNRSRITPEQYQTVNKCGTLPRKKPVHLAVSRSWQPIDRANWPAPSQKTGGLLRIDRALLLDDASVGVGLAVQGEIEGRARATTLPEGATIIESASDGTPSSQPFATWPLVASLGLPISPFLPPR